MYQRIITLNVKTIKLANIAKLWSRIISRRLYEFVSANNALNMDIQKGYDNIYGGVFNNVSLCKHIIHHAIENKNKATLGGGHINVFILF